MPTIKPASMTSRKTMRRLASICLFRDHDALRGFGVIFAHERIAARCERTQTHDSLRASGHDFLDFERRGIEFFGGGVRIGQRDFRRHVCLHVNLRRQEFMIFEGYLDWRAVARHGGGSNQKPHERRTREPNSWVHGVKSRKCTPVYTRLILIHKSVVARPKIAGTNSYFPAAAFAFMGSSSGTAAVCDPMRAVPSACGSGVAAICRPRGTTVGISASVNSLIRCFRAMAFSTKGARSS